MQRIDSTDNNKIKRLTSLKQKKVRLKENLFLIEGLKSVNEAVSENADVDIDMILISDSFMGKNTDFCARLERIEFPIYITSDHNFTKCSNLKTPQGIIASANIPGFSFEDIMQSELPIVVLDGISDPGNLGTIIRSADAFNFGGVFLLPGCSDAYSPKTVQSTMGSILRIKCVDIDISSLNELQSYGFTLYGIDMNGSNLSVESFVNGKTAVAIGSESHGLSSQVLEKCSKKLHISMYGGAESLNAAVAAGIVFNKVASEVYKD